MRRGVRYTEEFQPDAIIRPMSADTRRNAGAGPVVAIDGPVASGKTSVGRAVAGKLGLRFLDTGIMYRAVTWLALTHSEDVNDAEAMGRLARSRSMAVASDFEHSGVITVDGRRLSAKDLATEPIDRNVSAVAAGSAVRRALVDQQRAIASSGGIVMVGRDIGSVVLPKADVKLYVEASPEERARRRYLENVEKGITTDYQSALAETLRRDQLDSQRADSPLTIPSGAVVINTDGMDFPQSVDAVLSAVRAGAAAAGERA